MTYRDTVSARVQALGATLRTNARMGRQPYPEELQAMGDALFALAREVRMLEAANGASDAMRDLGIVVASARLQ